MNRCLNMASLMKEYLNDMINRKPGADRDIWYYLSLYMIRSWLRNIKVTN